jgi:hypothetical protein
VTPPTSAAGCNVCFDCGCTTTFHGESGECAGQFGICFCRKFVRWPTIDTNAFTPEFVHNGQVHRALSESNARVGEALDLLRWYVEWHRDELGVDTPGDYPKGDWLKCVEALLARDRKPAAPSAERGE